MRYLVIHFLFLCLVPASLGAEKPVSSPATGSPKSMEAFKAETIARAWRIQWRVSVLGIVAPAIVLNTLGITDVYSMEMMAHLLLQRHLNLVVENRFDSMIRTTSLSPKAARAAGTVIGIGATVAATGCSLAFHLLGFR